MKIKDLGMVSNCVVRKLRSYSFRPLQNWKWTICLTQVFKVGYIEDIHGGSM